MADQDPGDDARKPPLSEPQRKRCSHVSANGAGCRAYALKDSALCYYHDKRPEIVAQRVRSCKNGGRKANSHDGLADWVDRPITSLEELRKAASILFNAGAAGKVSARKLSALSSMANVLRTTIEHSDLEKRICELEEMVKELRR
ncbi:MAG: hypothetical protein NT137_00170 [Methanomassiliicoccales archaeon]|nr:hypothetical protein [Methanomassiliicoccales archaeon]